MSWADEVASRRDLWGRAPSAHNAQPWIVTSDADRLVVGWDEARHLPTGDPTRRDLLLSLGCVVEALVITAGHLGHAVTIEWDVDVEACRAAVLRAEVSGALPPWTATDLLARRTARSGYREPPLTAGEVEGLAAELDLPTDIALEVVPPAWVERWLPVADEWVLAGPAAGELAGWMRLSRRHARYEQDGLSDEALGLSRIEAVGLGLALRRPVHGLLRRLRITRLMAARATARPLGAVVALTAPAGLALTGVGELGRALLRVWLAARRRDWSAHPLSALLDCPASAAAWGRGTEWPTTTSTADHAPYAVFRLGVPTTPPPGSARLGQHP